jgi:hypothetical protein
MVKLNVYQIVREIRMKYQLYRKPEINLPGSGIEPLHSAFQADALPLSYPGIFNNRKIKLLQL